MNKVLFISLLIASISAFGSSTAEQIYTALNVEEESIITADMKRAKEKSTGGLSCIKKGTNEASSYSCTLKVEKDVDAQTIFDALDIEATTPPHLTREVRFSTTYTKQIGQLYCAKTENHRADDDEEPVTYGCWTSLN